jgi:hypothetical protein
MNLPTTHIERIKTLGYTEAEARFLYIVAVFSGYFTRGHFRTFTGSAYGKRSTHFGLKLLRHAHATVRDDPRRGSIFHLFSRTIYGQIEKDNLRNRKKHSFDFVRTRMVLLDFILANQDLAYFETEQDKVNFFCETMGVSKEFLPAKVYQGRIGSQPTIRYFVDKFPLFLAPPFSGAPPVVTLSYVDSGPQTPSSFAAHIGAYQNLFRQLNRFRFLYIAAKEAYFRMAEEQFRALVKQPLESDVSSEIQRYFRIRKKWESHQYIVPVTEDFEFLKEARERFHGDRFDTLYHAWRFGKLGDHELRVELSQLAPNRTVFFDTYLVHRNGSPRAAESGQGDGCMKDSNHHSLDLPRHPDISGSSSEHKGCV